jgi:3-oxoacyl-[acyl-carrier-protein] synthase-3
MSTARQPLHAEAPPAFRQAAIIGTGSYVPERILTNAELEKMVDTTDEWIYTRSGIRERRIAAPDQPTSDLAARAGARALEKAGVAAADLDQIIVATVTPDMAFPSTACFVQSRLGAKKAACFDVGAACSGFLYGLEIGRLSIGAGSAQTVLVIGAEKLSCVTDWNDRATCVLFGDGAGAVVLQAATDNRGVLGTVMGSDGTLSELLHLPGGGSLHPATIQTVEARLHYIKMAGREVFKHAVRAMTEAAQEVLRRCGLTFQDIACIIPHQANVRIIQSITEHLGVPLDKVYMNLEKYGNMSAATVPVALDEVARSGRIKRGDLVVLVAFGGGFTWGAAVVRW